MIQIKRIINKEVTFTGVGLHTGKNSSVYIKQGGEGKGIRFIREDLEGQPVIPADVSKVFNTQRGTTLRSGEATIATIEHLMAALHYLAIEDADIWVNGPEIPILDGSARPFIDGLQASSLTEAESQKEIFYVQEPFAFSDPDTGAEYAVFPSDHLEIHTILHFPGHELGDMVAIMSDKAQFAQDFSDSRTFVFLSEIEKLFDAGLIKGGDIDNALIILDKKMSDSEIDRIKSKIGKTEVSIVQSVLSSTPMKYANEPARHKLLDLVGDIYLLGRPVCAKIIATRPGHTSNVKLTQLLKTKYLEYRKNLGRPHYDVNAEPVMDVEKIKQLLPHRFPFLLVDKIIELTDQHVVGIKNISFNESFFQGHFPDNPIFPGVLQMEALAQVGGILALSISAAEGEKWDTYFLKMDGVKFKSKVVPGDTLILKMELKEPIRRGIVIMSGSVYVGNKLVSEGELTAQIVKRDND